MNYDIIDLGHKRVLTFFKLFCRNGILLVFLRGGGGGCWDIGSAALLPQYLGHVINILRVFRRAVVFDVVHANSPTLNLINTMCQFNCF